MSNRTYRAISLAAFSALIVLAQEPEPIAPLSQDAATSASVQPAVDPAAAHAPRMVAYCNYGCNGLVSSTGNLYFTNYSINEFGPDSTSFYRTGKYSSPGSEGLLYRESGDRTGFYYFGAVVWAFPGTYYGYFTANYNDFGVPRSQIKRVPLGGGSAVILANSPAYIGTRDLITDGSTLFWVDAGGIRSMPVGGGTIRTLVSSATVSHISFDANFVYYAEGNRVSKVPKAGGTIGALFFAQNVVTALFISPQPSATYILWGEKGGAVKSVNYFGVLAHTWQNPIAGRDVASVGFDGNRALWIDCTQPGNSYCTVRSSNGSSTLAVDGGVGARNLQWDSASMYWTSANGVMQYVY